MYTIVWNVKGSNRKFTCPVAIMDSIEEALDEIKLRKELDEVRNNDDMIEYHIYTLEEVKEV